MDRTRPERKGRSLISRLAAAAARAILVALLIALPAMMLPQVRPDTTQIVALLALVAAMLTFVEYVSDYPSLIEFRDAPDLEARADDLQRLLRDWIKRV